MTTTGTHDGDDADDDDDAYGLSIRLQNGEDISVVDIMERTLNRIDLVNPIVHNAIINRRCDRASLLKEAADVKQSMEKLNIIMEDKVKQGSEDAKTTLDLLRGIPIAIKDTSNVEGIRCTMGGSPYHHDYIPTSSDPYVQRMITTKTTKIATKTKQEDEEEDDVANNKKNMIVIGTTNAPQFGIGSHTYNDVWGTTLNPYNLERSCGGSSGGAAVAVATQMLYVADGTDMMGSLRNPAGWCNLYSIRPTAGIIIEDDDNDKIDNDDDSQVAVVDRNPLDYPISTPGPIGRTVRDLSLLLEIMVGDRNKFKCPHDFFLRHDDRRQCYKDNTNTKMTTTETTTSKMHTTATPQKKKKKVIKIAWLGDWDDNYPCEDGILDLCRSALETFSKGGGGEEEKREGEIEDEKNEPKIDNDDEEEVEVDDDEDEDEDDDGHWAPISIIDHSHNVLFSTKKLWYSWTTIRSACIHQNMKRNLQGRKTTTTTTTSDNSNNIDDMYVDTTLLKDELQWEMKRGCSISDKELENASKIAKEWSKKLQDDIFCTYDAIAMPSSQVWPFPIEWKYPTKIGTKVMDTYHRWMEIMIPVSLSGIPCVTIPAGFHNKLQLPIGIQLATRRYADNRLLRLAQRYHEITHWPQRRKPPLSTHHQPTSSSPPDNNHMN